MLSSRGTAIFIVATVTKAWEPLSVAFAVDEHGAHPFCFATVLVLCEAAKLICVLLFHYIAVAAHAHLQPKHASRQSSKCHSPSASVFVPVCATGAAHTDACSGPYAEPFNKLFTEPFTEPFTSDSVDPRADPDNERVADPYALQPLRLAWLLSAESARCFGVPALFLAVTNHMLGVGVRMLDPVLYQVIFKVISVLSTGALSQLVLRQPLTATQWLAMGLLLLGFWLSQPEVAAARSHDYVLGILVTLAGALSFAVQGVWFAAAVAAAPSQSTATQTAALGVWGVVVNGALLLVFHWEWLATHGAMHAFSGKAWIVVLSIAVTDLVMAVFFKFLGTNAYSFSRVAAMLVSTVLARILFGRHVTATFAAGASIVTLSGWIYQREEQTAAAGDADDRGGGNGEQCPDEERQHLAQEPRI